MATSAVLFAGMGFFAKVASSSASWMTVGAVRALVGAGVAYAVGRIRGVSFEVNDKKALFWRSLLGTASMTSTFYALSSRSLSLGDTVTLLNLTPIFLAVLAPIFLREPTGWVVGAALLLALGGVVLILHPSFAFASAPIHATLGSAAHGPSASMTAGAAVTAAFLSSIAMMLLRRVSQTESAESVAVHFSLFAAATLSLFSLFDLRLPTLHDFGCMVLAGLCAGFAQIAMTRAYTLERAARVSGLGYLAVVASALLGAAVLHETPTGAALLGMLLVVVGGLVVTFARDAAA